MADILAVQVKAVTTTPGTGNITLSDPASNEDRYRTDSEAVADGSLSDGDTVAYVIADYASSGPAAEWGYGTYTSATRTISRTAGNVLDSFDGSSGSAHGGGGGPANLINWAASGQRDVYLSSVTMDARRNLSEVTDADTACDNIGAFRLNTVNTVTGGSQTLRDGDWVIDRLSTARAALVLRNDVSGSLNLIGLVSFQAEDSGGDGSTQYSQIRGYTEDPTDGSEDGQLRWYVSSAGTLTERLRLASDGTLSIAGGDEYDHFPTGTKLLFASTIPTGWTRVNETSGRVIKLAESGDTINGTGGSDDIFDGSWATVGHAVTESEMPAHTHPHGAGSGIGFLVSVFTGGTQDATAGGTADTVTVSATGSTGGGQAHTHDMTTPVYRIAAWATKD